MASLGANCFIWQQIDRKEDRLPITTSVVAERMKGEVKAESSIRRQSWLTDTNDIRENSDDVLCGYHLYVEERKQYNLLCALVLAPSWLQAYQVWGRTGWWTDWGTGRASPGPASPGSLPLSHQESHKLCPWQWLHRGLCETKEEPLIIYTGSPFIAFQYFTVLILQELKDNDQGTIMK